MHEEYGSTSGKYDELLDLSMVIVMMIVMMVIMIVVIVAVPVPISILIMIPPMIMLQPAPVAVPVPCEKLLAVVMRLHPPGACIGRTRPIAFMPFVVVAYGIPVAAYPDEVRARTSGHHANHARWRGRANSNAK